MDHFKKILAVLLIVWFFLGGFAAGALKDSHETLSHIILFLWLPTFLWVGFQVVRALIRNNAQSMQHIIVNRPEVKRPGWFYIPVGLFIVAFFATIVLFSIKKTYAGIAGITAAATGAWIWIYERRRFKRYGNRAGSTLRADDETIEFYRRNAPWQIVARSANAMGLPRKVDWRTAPEGLTRRDRKRFLLILSLSISIAGALYFLKPELLEIPLVSVLLFVNLIAGAALLPAYPRTKKRISDVLANGTALPVLIAATRIEMSKNASYYRLYLYYEFGGRSFTTTELLGSEEYAKVKQLFGRDDVRGQFLTGFLLPQNPESLTVYELSPFKIEG
ncbi:MAG: hypothetical protein EHM45_21285 [Desulfobacteraceae bacterium]|nr:MAG: hypothetical protein EHM45_21285 [Desulfobacteraceae bacterium]